MEPSCIAFWNCANGALPKFDFIEHFIAKLKPEILFVSEAEIKNERDYKCIDIVGYSSEFSKTREFGISRQMAYVRANSGFSRVADLENGKSEVLVFWKNGLRVCGVYRPFKNVCGLKSKEAADLLLMNLDQIASTNDDLIIAGDMNVNWMSSSVLKSRLEDWSEKHGLIQGVKVITRHRDVKSSVAVVLQESCLDLVFQRKSRKITVSPSFASDHDLIVVHMNEPRPQSKTQKSWTVDWKKYSKEKAIKMLEELLLPSSDPEELWSRLQFAIVETLNALAPKRVI
jgi:hypothetical protein